MTTSHSALVANVQARQEDEALMSQIRARRSPAKAWVYNRVPAVRPVAGEVVRDRDGDAGGVHQRNYQ